jgi:hypothetical protein
MKRNELVGKLMKEGFSEKTLVNFTDKQLNNLSERMLGESTQKGSVVMSKMATNPMDVKKMTDQGLNVELREKELKGGQKKIDANKNGKIDAEDFKLLKKRKSTDKCPDCGKDEKDCKCDHTHMDESKKEVKNWVKNLVETKQFHSFTSKNEIMELIQTKLNESDTMVQHGPKVKKGHNGIPEFMSYDAIASAEPKTAPSKPAPSTKPGTRPTPTRREDPRKTPFQPGPGTNPKPKAKMAEEKKK